MVNINAPITLINLVNWSGPIIGIDEGIKVLAASH